MLPNPYVTERLAAEYHEARLREAEAARLARAAAGPTPKRREKLAWMALPAILAVACLWLAR